jgi:FkbM family methyltransferase
MRLRGTLTGRLLVRALRSEYRTLVTPRRLNNLTRICEFPHLPSGALVECGVGRGGCVALMALAARGQRGVWGFDSFDAMPALSAEDEGDGSEWVGVRCSGDDGIADARETLACFGLAEPNVTLVKGWFAETLVPHRDAIGPIAVLRLDNDWYASTRFTLETLYDRVPPGGVIVIDDYFSFRGCQKAVDEFRQLRGLTEKLVKTEDGTEAYWQKQPPLGLPRLPDPPPPGTLRQRLRRRLRQLRRKATQRSATLRALRFRLHALAERLRRNPAQDPVARIMEAGGLAMPSARFVQVGANDGVTLDPLRRQILLRQWSGVHVEPVPSIFERLRVNTGCRRLALENVAIADRSGLLPFYSVSDDPALGFPAWVKLLGSFRREVVESHAQFVPQIASHVICTPVPTMTWGELLDRHGRDRIDIVQIDAEGYDYQLLRTFPFERCLPSLMMYEHRHLSEPDRQACRSLLERQGYELLPLEFDTLALRRSGLSGDGSGLIKTWDAVIAVVTGATPAHSDPA